MAAANGVTQKKSFMGDWIIRLLKGILVGVGFIVPGLSGGVLAVVFGLYEPLMRFLANLRDRFIRNVLFFIPVGIGGVIGIVAFSAVVDWAFENYPAQFTWLFIGFIAGTFPSLFKTAGEKGRRSLHWIVLVLVAVFTVLFLGWMETISNVNLEPSLFNWVLSGALIGLGVVVPGMSPSNFLIYLGLYQAMANGIRRLDLGVIIPLAIGGLVCVLLLARGISWLFKKYHTLMYHLILGIVIGSTLAIAPFNIRGGVILASALLFVFGAACSYGLARLDEKYPHDPLF